MLIPVTGIVDVVVHVDRREGGPLDRVGGDLQHGTRPEVAQEEIVRHFLGGGAQGDQQGRTEAQCDGQAGGMAGHLRPQARTRLAPQVMPAPKATRRTRSPAAMRPPAHALVPEQGNGGGGGVAVALDVVPHLLVGQAQDLLAVLVDPLVGLVHEHHLEVGHADAVALQDLLRRLHHAGGGHLEDVAPVHDRDVLTARELAGVGVGPVLEAGARHVELLVVGAVRVEVVVEHAPLAVLRLDHDRGRRVAEEHGQVPELRVPGVLLGGGRNVALAVHVLELGLRPGHEAAVHLGPHEEHGPGEAGADVGVRELEAVEEAAALLADVEAGDGPEAELRLEKAAAPGEEVVGGHGGEDHEVDFLGPHLRVLERLLGRRHPEVGGGGTGAHVVAGLDAAALADPGVARVHEPRHHVVGDPVLRDL